MRPSLLRFTLAAVASLSFSAAAPAQGAAQAQKPGLWETKTTIRNPEMDAAMATMQQEMASMPPEQRQMVEKMMASQGTGMSGNAMTSRMCVTKEQAAMNSVPPQPDNQCQQKEVSRSANTIKYAYKCTGKQEMSGTGEFVLNGPTSWSMHSITDAVVEGKPQHTEMNVAGAWIADDCGSVKPFQVPKH